SAKLVYNPISWSFFNAPRMTPKEHSAKFVLCAAFSGAEIRGFRLAENAALQLKLPFRVANNVDRKAMHAVYDEASVFVLPTFYAQGYDLTVAEALARGCPVVVSATGSYLREFEDSINT